MKRMPPSAPAAPPRTPARPLGRIGAIELPGEVVLRRRDAIDQVLHEALDVLDLRVVQITVRDRGPSTAPFS